MKNVKKLFANSVDNSDIDPNFVPDEAKVSNSESACTDSHI